MKIVRIDGRLYRVAENPSQRLAVQIPAEIRKLHTVDDLRKASRDVGALSGSTYFPSPKDDSEPLSAAQKIRLEGNVSNKKLAELLYYIADMLE